MFEINPLIFICARYEDGTWSGTVQECGKLEPREFYSWADLAKKIDMYAANRSLVTELDKYYKPGGVWADTMLPKHRKGDLRLWVEITACQHGTWQGRTACTALILLSRKRLRRGSTLRTFYTKHLLMNITNGQ